MLRNLSYEESHGLRIMLAKFRFLNSSPGHCDGRCRGGLSVRRQCGRPWGSLVLKTVRVVIIQRLTVAGVLQATRVRVEGS